MTKIPTTSGVHIDFSRKYGPKSAEVGIFYWEFSVVRDGNFHVYHKLQLQ